MNFDLTDVQTAWKAKGAALGTDLGIDAAAADVMMGAARAGLLDANVDLLTLAVAVEALAFESPSAAIAFALHTGAALALASDERFSTLLRGETVGSLALSSDEVPDAKGTHLWGRAAWVAPITENGVAIVGARVAGGDTTAFAVPLDAAEVSIEPVRTAALRGFVCGHLTFSGAEAAEVGPTVPIMARVRVLVAAAGLGMGRRALREALNSAKRAHSAAAWEETVQGLLADAATDLDAAMMLTWKAALGAQLSLGDASMAKLAAGAAAQHAVERATQVIGADSFQRGHIVERLAQDVRALELFAGRTEALRAAAAAEVLRVN